MKKFLVVLACIALLCSMSVYAEESFDDAGSAVAASLEEAAMLYAGEVPGFADPAGFELNEVVVDDFGLTAFYTSNDASFEFSVYDYGAMEDISRYAMADGKLVPAEGCVVDLYEEDGMITSADVYTAKGAIYFYFENLDFAQVEAILACLNV